VAAAGDAGGLRVAGDCLVNRQPFQTPPQWWPPKMTPWWVRLCRPFRDREVHVGQRIVQIDVEGESALLDALRQGQGVLIAPNHSAHYDSTCLFLAAERLGVLCHFLTAWQVFGTTHRWAQWSYQRHGCFSIDRENTDVRAFKQAVEILQAGPYPLVIFPEGDIHHVSDRVMPFRDGAAAIALSAAKKSPRPIVCLPCAIKFCYLDDPTPSLLNVMMRLEERLLLRPRSELPLPQRILRLADVVLTIQEIDETGQRSAETLPRRLRALIDVLLSRLSQHLGAASLDGSVPERVKELRRRAIGALEQAASEEERARRRDLDDLFLVIQLYSYPGNYLVENPTPERLAETLDKLEEDILGVSLPTVHGRRRATIRFGEPISVVREAGGRHQVTQLTAVLEQSVQRLLDGLNGSKSPGVERSVATVDPACTA
jgi:1-acyl-sn-glycerol-3-phosphate acyltransferase